MVRIKNTRICNLAVLGGAGLLLSGTLGIAAVSDFVTGPSLEDRNTKKEEIELVREDMVAYMQKNGFYNDLYQDKHYIGADSRIPEDLRAEYASLMGQLNDINDARRKTFSKGVIALWFLGWSFMAFVRDGHDPITTPTVSRAQEKDLKKRIASGELPPGTRIIHASQVIGGVPRMSVRKRQIEKEIKENIK